MTTIYSARWVLPISSRMIEYGAVAVDDDRIVSVGPAKELIDKLKDVVLVDFGEAAVLPGLVNAHSHLELTAMRGFLEAEEHDFFAWLRKLTLARMAMTPEDLHASSVCGAIEAVRAGITCVADSSSSASQTLRAVREVGLRGVVYQESFGPDPKSAGENLAKLREQVAEMRKYESDLLRAGVSPHAPYTVSGSQLEMIARLALDENLPVMTHAAESQAEKLFMFAGSGPFAEGLRRRGIDWQAPGVSTIQYLAQRGIMETRPLLAHCITVDDADLELIKRSSAGIAHCPKSNAKLGHGCAPFAMFISRGVDVGLGSDSVASNNTCDILEEGRFAALIARIDRGTSPRFTKGCTLSDSGDSIEVLHDGRASAPFSADQALFAATLGGARALGLDNQIGALAVGMKADITVIRLAGAHQQPVSNPTCALLFSSSGRDVVMTMVAGREIYRDDRMTVLSEGEQRMRLEKIRSRLDALA